MILLKHKWINDVIVIQYNNIREEGNHQCESNSYIQWNFIRSKGNLYDSAKTQGDQCHWWLFNRISQGKKRINENLMPIYSIWFYNEPKKSMQFYWNTREEERINENLIHIQWNFIRNEGYNQWPWWLFNGLQPINENPTHIQWNFIRS